MKQNIKVLTIGSLAEKSGVGVETIRFYQREGLIKEPPKPSRGYRQYAADDIVKIGFIKRCQELGFSLREVKELLEFNNKSGATCNDIKKKTIKKLSEINQKITALKQMKKSLEELQCACDEGKKAVQNCDVMKCFDSSCDC